MSRISPAQHHRLSTKPAGRLNRRRFLKGMAVGTLGLGVSAFIDAYWIEPEWVEVVKLNLPLAKLPKAFQGRRIVHISDLHCSRVVTKKYLRNCLECVNALRPDLIMMTGDYITYQGRRGYIQTVVNLLQNLKSTWGVYACLGNHDYGVLHRYRKPRSSIKTSLLDGMRQAKVQVLQNQAQCITVGSDRLWIVGLGDLWSGAFQPDLAFAQADTAQPTIALMHNPDGLEYLQNFSADAVLCGHTHGGQVHLPLFGPPILPIKNKQYYAGMFNVGNTHLYVNRGLGRLGRVRFNCRPEITVFTLVDQAHSTWQPGQIANSSKSPVVSAPDRARLVKPA